MDNGMDDLSEKLAGILNDPDSMNRVRKMAESILSSEEKGEPEAQSPLASAAGLFSSDMPDADEFKKIIGIFSKLKSVKNDSRTDLLLALKPNLSEPKREKVDTAVKILKIIEILPYLRESGILNI